MRRILLLVIMMVAMSTITVGLASAQFEGDKGEARVLPPEACEARNPAGYSGAKADVIYDPKKEPTPIPAGPLPCILITPEFNPAK
jgi:hypothetical protein